jgi:hypothetical protein
LEDEVSRRSMHDACVLDIKTEMVFGRGHEALDSVAMDQALDALAAPHAVDEAELDARLSAGRSAASTPPATGTIAIAVCIGLSARTRPAAQRHRRLTEDPALTGSRREMTEGSKTAFHC